MSKDITIKELLEDARKGDLFAIHTLAGLGKLHRDGQTYKAIKNKSI